MSDYNDSLKRMTKIMSDSLLCTSQFHKAVTSSTAFATAQSVAKIMEPYRNLCKSFKTAYSDSIIKTIGPRLSQQLAKSLSDSIHKSFSDSLKSNPAFTELSLTLNRATPKLTFLAHSHTYDFPTDLGGISENDDYVVVDESAIKTYNLPDSVAIPIGNCRIKLPTSLFAAIVQFIIGTVITLSFTFAQSCSSTETANKQLQVENVQIQLLKSQNIMLQQLLNNIDTSSSSEIESINELKQSVEEQSKQLSQCQETLGKFEEALDNHETAENTDTVKKPIQ